MYPAGPGPQLHKWGPPEKIIFSRSFNPSHSACMLNQTVSQAECGINLRCKCYRLTSGRDSLSECPVPDRHLDISFCTSGLFGARNYVPSSSCQFHSHKRSPNMVFSRFLRTDEIALYILDNFEWDRREVVFPPLPLPYDYKDMCLDFNLTTTEEATGTFSFLRYPRLYST
ncbi:hypothetical protein Cgig2_008958 [Carnegiea gigantea]|uniref:Uncharacterized protein n=1 Tax=Carnegiea gigantea TaxID=171969 RepID=A0A9Q1K8U1_9CARY|nr:hypothetical protein Cgig2_008958 [Carnegiea gigantea]